MLFDDPSIPQTLTYPCFDSKRDIPTGASNSQVADLFHSKCDSQGPSIVLAKVASTKRVFGGYTSRGWASSGLYQRDTEAFLFEVPSEGSATTTAVAFPISMGQSSGEDSANMAVYWREGNGAHFGCGADLLVDNRGLKCNMGYCYDNDLADSTSRYCGASSAAFRPWALWQVYVALA